MIGWGSTPYESIEKRNVQLLRHCEAAPSSYSGLVVIRRRKWCRSFSLSTTLYDEPLPLRESSLPILNALTRLLAPAHSSASTPAPSPPLSAAPRPAATPLRSASFTMPPPAAWQPARARVQLKLSRERLRLLQQKKTQVAKQTRREVAGLLEKRKLESARIKVEGLLAEDLYVELLEVLELSVSPGLAALSSV
jgi:hypothetical protein